jgi:hypothetical protein
MFCGVAISVESILAQVVIAGLDSSDSFAVNNLSTVNSWSPCSNDWISSCPLVLILEPERPFGLSTEAVLDELELEKGGIRPVSVSLNKSVAMHEGLSDPDMVACRF